MAHHPNLDTILDAIHGPRPPEPVPVWLRYTELKRDWLARARTEQDKKESKA